MCLLCQFYPERKRFYPQNGSENVAWGYLHIFKKFQSIYKFTEIPLLTSTGDEPLDLSDKYYLAMDWRTNERLPVHCLVQNKEVGFDCSVFTYLANYNDSQ